MRLWTFLALAAGAGAPAQADITAIYLNDDRESGIEMKVEIAANGDLRTDSDGGRYLIKRGGRDYFVEQSPQGPVVEDFLDVVAVIQEELDKMGPNVCDRLQVSGPKSRLVSRGRVTIAGRSGEAYATEGRAGAPPQVVISRDPALAPLGTAMAAHFRMSMALLGRCATKVPMVAQTEALLESGAPLVLGPVRLGSVETKAIDPARFLLPAEPETREEVRARMFGKAAETVTGQPPVRK